MTLQLAETSTEDAARWTSLAEEAAPESFMRDLHRSRLRGASPVVLRRRSSAIPIRRLGPTSPGYDGTLRMGDLKWRWAAADLAGEAAPE